MTKEVNEKLLCYELAGEVSDAQKTVKLEVCTTKKLINHLINVWT
jgi:hypothetical protein